MRIYVEAYERKLGGFRAVGAIMTDLGATDKQEGEIRETLEDARNDAKLIALALLDGRVAHKGEYRNTKSRWRCNYYVA